MRESVPATEAIDPAVLKEAADDAFDADVLGQPGDARPQAADTPDDKLDLETPAALAS